MFWVKFDALRPYLAQQYVFLSDDNNLAQYSLDDYFNLGMYDGEIYKTKNLRNLSMNQMYPDPDDLKQAQDSIDNRLRTYGKDLWVPSREEYLAQKEAEANKEAALEAAKDSLPDKEIVVSSSSRRKKATSTSSSRSTTKKRTTKVKQPKVSNSSSSDGNSSAAKSVRRRKR
jgi:hypothetical protein